MSIEMEMDEEMGSEERCSVCGQLLTGEYQVPGQPWCGDCEVEFPPSLLKATQDAPWDYALRLRTGEVIRFSGATIKGDYIHIEGDNGMAEECSVRLCPRWPMWNVEESIFPRGMDVRLSDIVWCVDAPQGS